MSAPHLKAAGEINPGIRMAGLYDAVAPQFEMILPAPSTPDGDGAMMTLAQQEAMIAAWIAAFTAPTLRLTSAPLAVTANTVLGDLIAPTASWYAADQVVTFGSPYIAQSDGLWHVPLEVLGWYYSGTDAAETIQGFGLIDTF